MPGLIRGVARTAAIAGTATAVSGRVQRRQASRFAERDAATAYQRQEAYQQEAYAHQPPPAAPPAAGPAADSTGNKIEQLKQLGELRAQGILTEEEFAAEKAKLLG